MGGQWAIFGPRRALEWPPEAYRKWNKFAMTPESRLTVVFIYMLLILCLYEIRRKVIVVDLK